MKIRAVRPELFRVDGRTDGCDEASSQVSQFFEKCLIKQIMYRRIPLWLITIFVFC